MNIRVSFRECQGWLRMRMSKMYKTKLLITGGCGFQDFGKSIINREMLGTPVIYNKIYILMNIVV